MTGLRKLVNSTVAYTVANVLNSALPFFLLPILTRALSPAEYGTVAMFTSVMTVLSAFTGLSVHGAVSVKYFDRKIEYPQFVGSCLTILGSSTILVLLVVALFSTYLEHLTKVPKLWLILATISSAFYFLVQIRLVIWQVQGQPIKFGLFQLSQTLLNFSLSLLLILSLGMGWEGRVVGVVSAVTVFGLIGLYSLKINKLIVWKPNPEYIKQALRFGVPLIPHTIGSILISLTDKFIITSKLGLETTGKYMVGAQLAMVLGVLANSFVQAYAPHLYKQLSDDDAKLKTRLVKYSLVICLGFLLLAFAYSFLLPYLYLYLVGPQFQESLNVAKILVFGNAIEGMYFVFAGFIFYLERTATLAKLTIVCGLLNVPLTYIAVTTEGVGGAAWAYVTIQVAFFLGALLIVQTYYPLPWKSFFKHLLTTNKSLPR